MQLCWPPSINTFRDIKNPGPQEMVKVIVSAFLPNLRWRHGPNGRDEPFPDAGFMNRHFEVALEQVSQVVYEVWAENPEEAEEIASKLAMGREKPFLLLYSDVTCCCAD